jgi:hypothetical protein
VNVERQTISVNQFAELLGFEPKRFIGLQVNKQSQTIWLLLEPEMQTTGTAPQLASNTNYGKGKGGKTPKSGGKKKY